MKQIIKKAVGRPSEYSEEIATEICTHIAEGRSINSYCRLIEKPSVQTIYTWLTKHSQFLELYTRAREDQADTLADEMIDIADNASGPVMVDGIPLLRDGKPVMMTDAISINHARLRVDTRKWIASKLKPKKYGDTSNVDVKLGTGLANKIKLARVRVRDSL